MSTPFMITVHEHRFFSGSRMRTINANLIKTIDSTTCGNFAAGSNSKITFTDGLTMKVVDSAEDLRVLINTGMRPNR